MTEWCPYRLISPVSAGESDDLLAGKNKEDGIRRIQSLLAEWLRMENVVVLTAAGCSVGAGGRLMAGPEAKNLECLVLNAVENCPLSEEAQAIVAWKKANDFGSGNFEEWLGYLFNASSMTDGGKSPIQSVLWKNGVVLTAEDGKKLRSYVERAIFGECALELDRSELSGAGKAGDSRGAPRPRRLRIGDRITRFRLPRFWTRGESARESRKPSLSRKQQVIHNNDALLLAITRPERV